MRRNTTRKICLLALCSLGLLTGAACYYLLLRPRPPVRLEPQIVDCGRRPWDSEKITSTFQLKNESHESAIVEAVATSCGCTELVTDDGTPLSGLQIPGSASLRIQVTISPFGRQGQQTFPFAITCRSGTSSVVCAGEVRMDVRATWRIAQPELVLRQKDDAEGVTGYVRIFDGEEFSGDVADVRSSSPRIVTGRVESCDASDVVVGGDRFTSRRRLMVQYVPSEAGETRSEQLSIIPSDATFPELSLRVLCQTRRPMYRPVPSRLTLLGERPGSKVVRRVRCEVAAGAQPTVQLLRAPDFVTAVVGEREGLFIPITITCKVPNDAVETMLMFAPVGSAEEAFGIALEIVPDSQAASGSSNVR